VVVHFNGPSGQVFAIEKLNPIRFRRIPGFITCNEEKSEND